jgi:hypothetical protein
LRNDFAGAMFLKGQFGVPMDVTAQLHKFSNLHGLACNVFTL